jgi:hypothetical protein
VTIGVILARPLSIAEREPTSAMSEAVLDRAYSRSFVDARSCACGGVIRVFHLGDHAIAHAVSVHGQSTEHEQWAIAAGWR